MSNKCWKIEIKDVQEPWYYDEIFVYAETGDKAKSKAWKENIGGINDACVDGGWAKDFIPADYLDLRAKRYKEGDKVEYEGELVTKQKAEQLQWGKDRDEYSKHLGEEHPDKTVVIWNGSYNCYWGANRSGYSSTLRGAGLYSTQEAYDIVKGSCYSRREEVRLTSKEDINKHIDSEIDVLKMEIKRLENFKL